VVRGGGFFPACELVAKRKRKRRARSTLLIIAIAVLIAGFIIRRTLVPRVLHYLAYRPAENPNAPASGSPSQQVSSQPPAPPSAAAVATPAARRTTPAPSEHLTESDRQQLEDILRRRSR
jgi:cytoskeletal protein RodZ